LTPREETTPIAPVLPAQQAGAPFRDDFDKLRDLLNFARAKWTLNPYSAVAGVFALYRDPEYEPGDSGRVERWVDCVDCTDAPAEAIERVQAMVAVEIHGSHPDIDDPYVWWEVPPLEPPKEIEDAS
jgi:hypothetical protein